MMYRRKKNIVDKTTKPQQQQPPIYTLSNDIKQTILAQSYIGKKGYTIPKSILPNEELEFLTKDLYLKPEVMGARFAPNSQENTAFPVYRENDKKIYIPRFYGIQRYGRPTKCELDPGLDINVPFAKELRDYQENIIDIYMKYVNNPNTHGQGSGGILQVPCGRGKTIMALKLVSLLKKKTLILVHKEFLMNQWIERINEFLPTATIGKIQANVCDYQDKDIVIGMIQTMYNKTFSQEIYSQFGLTVIDEVHRIGSEEFSKTLLKTITPYMLGISATVERKDKLTKLLYMFIGEKIYSEERKKGDEVCVRGIEYHSNDEDFNLVECDFRGQPKFSTMISKLSDHGPRNDFIIRVAHDLLEETPEGQIMILGHNRSMLKYLYDAITHKKIATVGYYVGGMKQADLQASETKQIVLATYAMAAEALDIKTLSMMIMATPKTDITQSVGRILRMKHDNPVVVDIVDMHELFQNQWKQRKRFYKKCNYRIRSIDNKRYSGMCLDWDTDKTWTWVFEPKNDYTVSAACSSNKDVVIKSDSEPEENTKDTATTIFKGKCFINMDEL